MSSDEARCPGCDAARPPWITTCATCGAGARHPGEAIPLADQPAPPMTHDERWIDIPLSADEPVLVALFRNFCTEREIEYVESRRFVSVRADDASRLLGAITPWAFEHDMPDDPREHDSLADTLHRIGNIVVDAVHAQHGPARHGAARHGASRPGGADPRAIHPSAGTGDAGPSTGIDLR